MTLSVGGRTQWLALAPPMLLPENFVSIQLSEEHKRMPKDVKEFIDNAGSGVILFSMGLKFDPDELPVPFEKALIEAQQTT